METAIVALIVGASAFYLVIRYVRQRRRAKALPPGAPLGCDGCCEGCHLKHQSSLDCMPTSPAPPESDRPPWNDRKPPSGQ